MYCIIGDVAVKEETHHEDVQVRLDMPDRRRAKVQDELELALKRQLNKERRDQQVLLHQEGLKEWLQQGNHINAILNDTTLFQVALKLLSSAQAYPKDKTDSKYFEQICTWFSKKALKLEDNAPMYPPLVDDLDLKESLRKQITAKIVKSRRDFVLIFIILLRAIGIQCRMVVNLVVPPIRPPQSELCRIAAKQPEKEKAPKVEPKSAADKKKLALSSKSKTQTTKKVKEEKESTDKTPKKEPSHSSKLKKSDSSPSSSPTKPRIRTRSRATSKSVVIPQVDGANDEIFSPVAKRTRARSNTPQPEAKSTKVSKNSVDSPIRPSTQKTSRNRLRVPMANSEELFAIDNTEKKTVTRAKKSPLRSSGVAVADESAPAIKIPRLEAVKRIDRRVLSTDNEEEKTNKNKTDFWVEAWSEKEEKWMCIDLFKSKVNSPDTLTRSVTLPIAYVLAWPNNGALRDVSLRYCPNWHSVNRKQRTEQDFVDAAMKPFLGSATEREIKDELELASLQRERPMPTSIGEFKNHPMYALKRHLLKFEAIYPPNPLTLGFVRGEPVYARECVHELHSREMWVKQARVVKPGETPYKVVTARPKYDRRTDTVIKDQPLELFGLWQTSEYEPPVAENGVVPKNAYGNVELFKPCMLPINTVHLPCKCQ